MFYNMFVSKWFSICFGKYILIDLLQLIPKRSSLVWCTTSSSLTPEMQRPEGVYWKARIQEPWGPGCSLGSPEYRFSDWNWAWELHVEMLPKLLVSWQISSGLESIFLITVGNLEDSKWVLLSSESVCKQ